MQDGWHSWFFYSKLFNGKLILAPKDAIGPYVLIALKLNHGSAWKNKNFLIENEKLSLYQKYSEI